MKRITLVFAAIAAVLMAGSCATATTEIEENLSPGEFFQKGQAAAMEFQNYELALQYYTTFIERYPEQQVLIVEAEYEIAFLYYKMGDTAAASELFGKLLEKYRQPEAAILPAWPEVLAKKIIQIIDEEKAETEEGSSPVTEEE